MRGENFNLLASISLPSAKVRQLFADWAGVNIRFWHHVTSVNITSLYWASLRGSKYGTLTTAITDDTQQSQSDFTWVMPHRHTAYRDHTGPKDLYKWFSLIAIKPSEDLEQAQGLSILAGGKET